MTKAVIDFSGYAGPNLLPIANTIHDSLVANAATFGSPPLTMAAFQTSIVVGKM